jgi:hypothetical protein
MILYCTLMSPWNEQDLDAAMAQSAEENGLSPAYISIARPMVKDPDAPRPQCCGGGCEPCAELLNRVIERAIAILQAKPPSN